LKEIDRKGGDPIEDERSGERGRERLERVERGVEEDEQQRNGSKE
jgi:hypothetical protein